MSIKGGKRIGAGRPINSGKFGETTKSMRVPLSMVNQILYYIKQSKLGLPLYGAKVSAGFPSPADDFLEGTLDLNEYLIKHPSSTFFVRVSGESMVKAGIFPNDILVVDRSLNPAHGKIVIAIVNNELTVKRLHRLENEIKLLPENDHYSPILISNEDELIIWGVVTQVLHAV